MHESGLLVFYPKYFCVSRFPVENLKEELKPVVTEKHDLEQRSESFLVGFFFEFFGLSDF